MPSTFLTTELLLPFYIARCGPLTYSVETDYENVVTIKPPDSGLTFEDEFTLTVDTRDVWLAGGL